ncbi:MAG: PAS domain S-box protein [Candidatus Zixiibacteriota bacterium]
MHNTRVEPVEQGGNDQAAEPAGRPAPRGTGPVRMALRETDEALRVIFNSVHDAIFIHDEDGTVVDVNDRMLRMYDLTRQQALGYSILNDYSGSGNPAGQVREIWARTLAGEDQLFEWKARRPRDGSQFDCEVFLTAIKYRGRRLILATVRDITVRKQEQEVLRAATMQLQALFNASPLGIMAVDRQGRVTLWNAAAERMFGWTREEVIGRSNPLASETRQSEFETLRARVVRGESSSTVATTRRRKDGTSIEISLSTAPLRDAAGTIIGHMAVMADITAQKQAEKALRESEEKYRTLIENINDVAYAYDPDGVITYITPNVERIAGYSPGEIVGRNLRDFVHADDIPQVEKGLAAITQEGKTVPFLGRIHTKSGGLLSVEELSRPVRDAEGSITHVVGIIRDISARMRDQDEIRKLSQAVEQSPISIIITDLNGNIEYANRRFAELTGYSLDEVRGKNPRLLKSGLMSEDVYRDLWSTIRRGERWQGILHNRKKNGELYWEMASICAITDEHGRITHYLALKENITERVLNEREFRKLSTAMVQSANLISMINADGFIEFVNPRFCQVTGYGLPEVIAKPLSVLQSPDNDEEVIAAVWGAIRSGATWSGRLRSRRKNGEIFWEHVTLTPVRDETGRLMNFVLIGEDITAEIAAQQQLLESDKLAAIGVLAAGVSHEFKNYLGGIIGNASFTLDQLAAGSSPGLDLAKETLSQIIDLGEKANQVAMTLLSYSKSRTQDRVRTNLHPIITDTLNLVEKEMRGRGIEVVTYLEAIPDVEVSPSKIQQLLLNLLINAQDAIEGMGVVSIVLTADDTYAWLKVGDTGIGIPAKNLARIFDPFFSTKGVWGQDRISGTGMGLAICRNIAREHSGDMLVESLVGIGSTFSLRLPLSTAPNPEHTSIDPPRHLRLLIFSSDQALYQHYFKPACSAGASLHMVDDVARIEGDLRLICDLVICDARFSGKIELLKMAESSRLAQVPYVMVQCGALEYQLSHLYDHALANYKELPEFDKILSVAVTTASADAGKP